MLVPVLEIKNANDGAIELKRSLTNLHLHDRRMDRQINKRTPDNSKDHAYA